MGGRSEYYGIHSTMRQKAKHKIYDISLGKKKYTFQANFKQETENMAVTLELEITVLDNKFYNDIYNLSAMTSCVMS